MITPGKLHFVIIKVIRIMKNSCICIFLILISVLFLDGCTELKQNRTFSESQPNHMNKLKEEGDLSANYYYLESRIHIKNQNYQSAIVSLKKALVKDPDSFILTRDLIQLYLRQNNREEALALVENLVQQRPDGIEGLLLLVQLKKD